MTRTRWRVALGVVAWSFFFWGVAGAVELGLARTRKGFTLPDGGEWYGLAAFAGFIVGYFTVGSLTDLVTPRRMALIPTAGACVGAVSCLVMGQEARHWIAALALVLIGAAVPAAVHLRVRATAARRSSRAA